MPISSPSTFPPVLQEFVTHWSNANAALGASPLLLRGAYTAATLSADRAAVVTALTTVEDRNNVRQNAAANRDLRKAALYPRLSQFKNAVRYQLAGSQYAETLARLPDISRSEAIILRTLDDMGTQWAKINADATVAGFTPPLTLIGGYNKAAFDLEMSALRAAYSAVNAADVEAKLARKRRDLLLTPARQRMQQYRIAVLAKFGANDALTLSLPKYTPEPGSTPDPVNLSVVWEPTLTKARLVWSASSNARLSHYEVRQSGGASYKTSEESNVATVAKTETQLLTTAGLTAPGAVNAFKVYVITTDGNERGSNTAKVSRPLV